MELSLRRWKPGQLLLSWGAYWAGLIGVTMGPAIRAAWRATTLPDGHGSINAGFNNGTLTYDVIEEGVKTVAGSTQFSTALLWLVGPPLALWVLWLLVRRRPEASQAAVSSGAADRLSAGSGPAPAWRVMQDDRVSVEREELRTPNP
jgi:hypothetical protein